MTGSINCFVSSSVIESKNILNFQNGAGVVGKRRRDRPEECAVIPMYVYTRVHASIFLYFPPTRNSDKAKTE